MFFLNNQPCAKIIQICSVIKFYMFRASSLPITRSFLLYIRHSAPPGTLTYPQKESSTRRLYHSNIAKWRKRREIWTVHNVKGYEPIGDRNPPIPTYAIGGGWRSGQFTTGTISTCTHQRGVTQCYYVENRTTTPRSFSPHPGHYNEYTMGVLNTRYIIHCT
jgi:hypothetical protein